MLTSVSDVVVALAQVPSDFYSLFGVAAANATVMYAGGDGAAGVAAAARSALPPPMSPVPAQVPPISGIEGLPVFRQYHRARGARRNRGHRLERKICRFPGQHRW